MGPLVIEYNNRITLMYFYVMKLEYEVDSNEAIIQTCKIIYTENYQWQQLFIRNMVLK